MSVYLKEYYSIGKNTRVFKHWNYFISKSIVLVQWNEQKAEYMNGI